LKPGVCFVVGVRRGRSERQKITWMEVLESGSRELAVPHFPYKDKGRGVSISEYWWL
jgi:hypothetical protein